MLDERRHALDIANLERAANGYAETSVTQNDVDLAVTFGFDAEVNSLNNDDRATAGILFFASDTSDVAAGLNVGARHQRQQPCRGRQQRCPKRRPYDAEQLPVEFSIVGADVKAHPRRH